MTKESKEIETKEHSRISVQIGDFKVDIEGTYSNVVSLMEKYVINFIENLQKTMGGAGPQISEEGKAEEEIIPPLGRPSSTTEALSTLFKTDWGRKPRTLSEIMNALETNGLYYKKPVVAKVLVDLVKKKEIRRLGSRGNYRYVAA